MKFIRLLFWLSPLSVVAQSLSSSNLPIVVINTSGQEIPDEPKITAQMQVRYKGPGQRNNLSDPPDHYNGLIGIERRGSTSDFFSDKKPYSVELRDLEGEDQDFPLLGMPAEADWAFIAPYNDKSLIRDALLYDLARRIMPWAPRTRFVELILNGQYEGIYMVTERIKRGKDRVDVAKLKATDTAGEAVTGGYILKIDKAEGSVAAAWGSPFPSMPGSWQSTLWQVHYPKQEDIQPAQFDYIQDWITEFETVMSGPDFADPQTGYPKYLDVPSFVDFTLLNEMAKNVDAYRISTFFHKDRDGVDSLLHAGPVWDFNIAFGNCNYCGAESASGWQISDFNVLCGNDGWVNHFWWPKMWQDPQYRRKLKERWAALRQGPLHSDSIAYVIDSLTMLLQESQARNFQRWPVLNTWVWPNVYCCGPYTSHVNYLETWLNYRLLWMDGAAKTLYVGEYVEADRFDTRVFPNPSFGEINFRSYLRYRDRVLIRIYDAMGRYQTFLEYSPEEHGEFLYTWPNDLSPGVYFYEVTINEKRESSGRLVVGQ